LEGEREILVDLLARVELLDERHAKAGAENGFPVAEDVPRESDTGSEIVVVAIVNAANLTLPELIRISGSPRRQLHTLKSSDTLLQRNQADPAEGVTEAEWPFPPDPNWFASKP